MHDLNLKICLQDQLVTFSLGAMIRFCWWIWDK